ncbi:MAG: sporulation protein YqfC [Halanaerobiales bacterium]
MKSLKKSLQSLFDLPEEIVLDYPLIMLVGNSRLFLENHRGLSLYREEKIKIKTKTGFITINGSKLSIEEINSTLILINGEIGDFSYD